MICVWQLGSLLLSRTMPVSAPGVELLCRILWLLKLLTCRLRFRLSDERMC